MKNKNTSPALRKLSASCKAAAKRKFDVYPSAYANMWASKQQGKGKCQMKSPFTKVRKTKAKGGGTKKVCLPYAKIKSMSKSERLAVISAKRKAGAAGKYKRSSKSNVTGTSSGGSLKTWVKQDWRQVANPSLKCGESPKKKK